MKKLDGINPATVVSVLIVLLAALVMIGWWLHKPIMVQIFPGYVGMVFNTALCFTLAGLALLLPASRPHWRRRGQTAVGIFIVVLASAVLAEHLFNFKLGVDMPMLHAWLDDPNPSSGRMAPNTALGFILSGLVLIFMHRVATRAAGIAIQVLTFLVLAIGITGLIGYALKLELLYNWYQYARMAVHTAMLFIFLGAALWLNWIAMPWSQSLYRGSEDEKISMIGGAILIIIALTTGLGAFVLLQQQTETTLKQSLTLALQNRVNFFQATVEQGLLVAQTIATRPTAIKYIERLEVSPNDAEGLTTLNTIAKSFLGAGFQGVALHNRHGREIVRAGEFTQKPEAVFRLDVAQSAELLRVRQKIILRVHLPMLNQQGRQVGTMGAEIPMPYLVQMFSDFRGLGETGEMAVCAPRQQEIECFPLRLSPNQSRYPRNVDGTPLPINRAFAGETGVISGKDYRAHNVIAAYSPIGKLGLGMVMKMDTAELYQPIRQPLQFALPFVLFLVLCGALLLRWQITPLVRRLLASENAAHNANAALRDSELRVRAVLENATDGIITINQHGIVESFNAAATKIFGYPPQEVLGQNVKMLMPASMRDQHEAGLQRYLQTGTAQVIDKGPVEMPGQRRDGAVFPMELGINEVRLEGQHLFIGILRNITERKRVQQALAKHTHELARSNAELEQFARIASHDLQEPLRKVQAFGDRIKEKYSHQIGAEGLDYLERMLNATVRMQALIDGLLSFARVNTRAQAFATVDLNQVAQEVITDLEIRIHDTQARVEIKPLPIIEAEALQLRQLLQNLIGNALKFRRPGIVPEIRVSAHPVNVTTPADGAENKRYEIIVEDNGIGFDEKYLDRIFGIFQRLHGRHEYEGSGVGLAICRKIAEYHGGDITARSQPGQGAKFIVTLPAIQSARSP